MSAAAKSVHKSFRVRTFRPPPLSPSAIALLVVGLLFLVLQLVFAPRPLGLSTDEATYLAKVDPSAPELYWTQPRAWGIPVLAAPVALFAPGLTVVRAYFSLLSSTLLIAAFWPWLRVLGAGVAPLAALLFSTTWFTLYFGPQVMPNLYVGLCAVGAIGMFLRAANSPRWWRYGLCGAAAALVALVRPTDSVLALAPVFLWALVVRRLRNFRLLAALAGGVIIGWLPWIAEAFVRFGDPITRLRTAEKAGPQGLSLDITNLLIYPRLLDGAPLYCCATGAPSAGGPIPLSFAIWLVAATVVALIGVILASRRGQWPEMLLIGSAAVSVAGFYLLLPSFTALRFLLPAFALIMLPVAVLLAAPLQVRGGPTRALAVGAAAAAVIAHLGLMVPKAESKLDHDAQSRRQSLRIAASLRPYVHGRPCLILGREAQTTAYYLKCQVQRALPTARAPRRVTRAQAHDVVVVAVLPGRPAADSYMASWRELSLKGLSKGVRAYVPPDQEGR